jgi:small subunit ribosomal protein S20
MPISRHPNSAVADLPSGLVAWRVLIFNISNRNPSMANTKSAKKATRVSARRTAINQSRTSALRTSVRKVEEAIAGGKKTDAETALQAAAPQLMRGAQKGVLHKNAASRKVSRLTKRVKAMAG